MMTYTTIQKSLGWASAALALVLLQGCASGPNANPADPLEPLNRTIFKFNDGLDRAILKPVATAYQDATPALVRTGVSNFFGNISDVWSVVNNALQLKGEAAANSFFRVTTNTFWGLGGVFDVASELKIPKQSEDFGKTLTTWGVAPGPYIVLPLLGPSTARDSVGTFVDMKGDLVSRGVDRVPVRNSLRTLRLVDTRAKFLEAGDLLDQAALDKYSFTRDIYLQRHRRASDTGGTQPEERFDLPEQTTPAGRQPAGVEAK